MNWEFIDKRAERNNPVGGLIENQPVIFGGRRGSPALYLTDCISLGQPNMILQTLQERRNSSGLVVNKAQLWVAGGGILGEENYTTSTEFISVDKPPIKGPELPFVFNYHTTMIQVDPKTIYLIGGFQSTINNGMMGASNKTWIVNPKNNYEITEGPYLNEARYCLSSAMIQLNGRAHIVLLDTDKAEVELLDTTSSNLSWTLGKTNILVAT